jgi:glycosyltransferase involved in cell wall biosynthesis
MFLAVTPPAAKNLTDISTTGGARALSVAIYLHDLAGGGVERQSLIIAEEFRRHGVDVTLVLHRLRGQLLDQVPPGLRIVDLNSSRTVMDIPGLVRYMRAEKPDILLSNVDFNNVAALFAKALSFSKTKVVICQHNPISGAYMADERWISHQIGFLYWVLSPLISRAVAVSSGVAAELRETAGIPVRRVVTINNPVVGPDFAARCQQSADHPWFNQAGHPLFVTAGRLVAQKDHATMIRALAIHRQRFDSRLIILGTGHLREKLGDLVVRLELTNAVDFLGFQANSLPYFRHADAFILSSRGEGFGNVIVEALGCGTPVISTRCIHGPAEILDGGRYGLLVEPHDPDALAAAMDQVTTLRERFPADMLRERAGYFSYAACASRYLAIFRSLAPQRAWTASA